MLKKLMLVLVALTIGSPVLLTGCTHPAPTVDPNGVPAPIERVAGVYDTESRLVDNSCRGSS